MTFRVPNQFRIRGGRLASDDSFGTTGAFLLRLRGGQELFSIASAAMGWEHVSASRPDRCPTWEEMCEVKALFWEPEDCVVQFHPPESQYVNLHPHCLHLWRPTAGLQIPTPPTFLVGPRP